MLWSSHAILALVIPLVPSVKAFLVVVEELAEEPEGEMAKVVVVSFHLGAWKNQSHLP